MNGQIGLLEQQTPYGFEYSTNRLFCPKIIRGLILMPFKDKEKAKEWAKQYYQKNKEKILAYGKELRNSKRKKCKVCNISINMKSVCCWGCSKKSDKNPAWKGEKAGYTPKHIWIKKNKPKPALCEYCKVKPPYDLANLTHTYKRDINDYKWLCRGCHMKYDYKMGFRKGKGG